MKSGSTLAVIGTVGVPPRYGGFETLAHFLSLYLAATNDLVVYCSGPSYAERLKRYHSARLKYIPLRANGSQSIAYDFLSIIHACFSADVLLVLGVSGGIFLPLACLFRKRIVLNVGGLDWQRSKWGKWASHFLRISEAVAVWSTDTLIADNAGIANYFQNVYGRASVLIEYGGDQVTSPALTEEQRRRYPFLQRTYAFSVARIQPDNNIEMILEAFAASSSHTLVLVGNWGASEFGKDLKARFYRYENLYLLDAIYDPDELNALRAHCSIYVHGHSAGGTNPSLVEAMNLGLPIAAFDVIYNRQTTEGRARYFNSSADLAKLLSCAPPSDWESQRALMKEIALRRYRWSTITGKYADVLGMCIREEASEVADRAL